MLGVFSEVVLPVLVIIGLGAVVGRWRRLQAEPLATLVLYLLAPTLVFDTLSRTDLSIDIAVRVAIVMVITLAAMLALSLAWSTWRGHGAAMRSGFALVATSPNFGNMGLAIATLAFGELGLEVAVLTFVLGALFSNTVGVAVGSMAERAQWKRAVVTPLRFPFIYAAAAGVAFNVLAVDLPVAVSTPVAILAGAAIPVMLVVLGVQISHGLDLENVIDLGAVTVARLLVAPALTWAVTSAVGLHGIAQATLVTVAAMPAAVITTIIATRFDASPSFVTRAVVLSTLVSILTLTVLIDLVS
jgi:predicted permease